MTRFAEILLLEYGNASSIPAPVNRMMLSFAEDFRQDKDINLGVGYVNEKIIPGEFCVHSSGDLVDVGKRQLRLSYGYEEVDRIREAISLIKEAVDYAKYR